MLITAIGRYADRPAIADNRTRWTYRELWRGGGPRHRGFSPLGS